MSDEEMMAEDPKLAKQIIAARKRIIAEAEAKRKADLPNSSLER